MKENIPEAVELMTEIQKHSRWSPVYRAKLEELFLIPAFKCALNECLCISDDMLKNAGMTDFTDEVAVKNALRAQGIALGLVQAVEAICELASTPETQLTEEKKDA